MNETMNSTSFPEMIEVRQKIYSPRLDNPLSAIREALRKKELDKKILKGMKIAVTAGSRGIAQYDKILATVVEEIRRSGGEPFLIPAMGSHGGATPSGQLAVLESLGITPDAVGAPILSSMEVDEVGRIEGEFPIYMDRIASKAGGIIIVGRIKPHTDFKGKIESGLMKMMSIGLGKQKGAETIHRHQSEGYHKFIPAAARIIMKKTPILMGLAIVENAHHEIAIIKALDPNEIEENEVILLEKAKDLLPRIPFKNIDVLIVDEIGKNISGVGMDTNVIGRFWLPGETDTETPKIKKIVVLDLCEETHGNAIGIGLADVTTKKVVSKIDYDATYVNCLTVGSTEAAKIPPFLPNDRDAIATAIRICGPIRAKEAKVVRIRNTLELERFWISESLLDVVKFDVKLAEKIEVLSKPREMQFDVLGTLVK